MFVLADIFTGMIGAATVFICVLIFVRALLKNRLPRRTFMFLWVVALSRLLIPYQVPVVFDFQPFISAVSDISMSVPETNIKLNTSDELSVIQKEPITDETKQDEL